MTRSELAQLVVEHVWFHEGIEAPLDRKYIAKLELGVTRYPMARYRRALREILDAGSDLDLGFMSPNRSRAAGALPAELDPRDLGDLLSGRERPDAVTDALVDGLWRERGPGSPPPADDDPPAADLLRSIVAGGRELAHLDRLLDELHSDGQAAPSRRVAADRVRVAAATKACGRRVLAAAAELCQVSALSALDAGRHDDAAAAYLTVGVRAANAAANAAFAAHLFSLLAYPRAVGRSDTVPVASWRPPLAAGELDEIVRWAVEATDRAGARHRWPDVVPPGRVTGLPVPPPPPG
jgi:hypothetical protein